jgi:hypothetical protein
MPLPAFYCRSHLVLVLTEDMVQRFSRNHNYTTGNDMPHVFHGHDLHRHPSGTRQTPPTPQLLKFLRSIEFLNHSSLAEPEHSLPNFFGDLTMKKILFASLLAATLLASTAWAQTCPSWPTADRFTLNDDEVTDKRTGLTWKRCSEGQTWSGGTCTGTLTARSHEAALTLANTGQGPTGWRLPNVKELASLADKGCQVPSIDSTAFPATPINWYWASSPDVGSSGKAWCVSFYNGKVSNSLRGGCFHVRLVRSSQ